MVLDDIVGCVDVVVIVCVFVQVDVFGYGDLYVVDVVCILDWVEQLVGELQCQDVLYCFFVQVVVDVEDCFFWEDCVDCFVQFVCVGQVVVEWFFYYDLVLLVVLWVGQVGFVQLFIYYWEGFGWDCQVEGVVVVGVVFGVEFFQCFGELGECVVVVESVWYKMEFFGQLVLVLLLKWCLVVFLDGVVYYLIEILGVLVLVGKFYQ